MTHMQVGRITGKLTGTYLAECDTRTVIRVDIGGNLEDKACEFRLVRLHFTLFRLYRTGTGSNLHKAVQQLLHTEVIQGGTEEYGSQFTFQIFLYLKFGIYPVYQLQLAAQLVRQRRAYLIIQFFRIYIHFHFLRHHLFGRLVQVQIMFVDVINSLKAGAALDRPCQRTDMDGKLLFQLIQQVKRVFRLTVHLIDEDNHRSVAHTANLHQLARLGFHTFRAVHHNDNAVHRRQGTVSIFGKVLVTRSIENIDFVIVIIKLHYRSGYRDTTLFFNIHPVRRRRLLYLVAFHRARHLNLTAKQQQLFSQRCLTGIRMRDNRKGSSSFYLVVTCHI